METGRSKRDHELRITSARAKGRQSCARREGVNLPRRRAWRVDLPSVPHSTGCPLGDFAAECADIVGLSFIERRARGAASQTTYLDEHGRAGDRDDP